MTPIQTGGNAPVTDLVSVLVRSTARLTLQRALDSISAQDFPGDIEIVVVAASGSAHPDLPTQWNGRAIRLLRSEQPLTRPAAANRLLDAARGDFVAFLDDDDQWLPWHVSTLTAVLKDLPHVDLAYSIAAIRDEVGGDRGTVGRRAHPLTFAEQLPFVIHAAMLRKTLLTKQSIRFDETLEVLEDLDFFIACATQTYFAFTPVVTAIWNAASGESGHGVGANAVPFARERGIGHLRQKWMSHFERWQAQPVGQLDLAELYLNHDDLPRAEKMLQIASRNQWSDQTLLNRFLNLCQQAELVDSGDIASSAKERVVHVNTAVKTAATTGQSAYRMSAVGAVKAKPSK